MYHNLALQVFLFSVFLQVTPTLTSIMQSTEVVRSDSLDDADPEPVFAGTATAKCTGLFLLSMGWGYLVEK